MSAKFWSSSACPPRPKRPLKPKVRGGIGGTADLSVVAEDEVEGVIEEEVEEVVEKEVDGVDLVDSMRNLGLAYFAEVSAPTYCPAILPFGS